MVFCLQQSYIRYLHLRPRDSMQISPMAMSFPVPFSMAASQLRIRTSADALRAIKQHGGTCKIGLRLADTDSENLGHFRIRCGSRKPYAAVKYIAICHNMPASGQAFHREILTTLVSGHSFLVNVERPHKIHGPLHNASKAVAFNIKSPALKSICESLS